MVSFSDGTDKSMTSLKMKVIGHSIRLLAQLKVVYRCSIAQVSLWGWILYSAQKWSIQFLQTRHTKQYASIKAVKRSPTSCASFHLGN